MWAEVIYSDEDRKFDKDITVGLICSELLNLAEYNVHMAKLLGGGRNKAATEFAISLIQTLLINDSKVISKLHNFVDALAKLAARLGSPESLQQLVEGGNVGHLHKLLGIESSSQFVNKLQYAKKGARDIMDRTCAGLP